MENLPSSPPLDLSSPWLNAAGTLGFTPGPAWNWPMPQGAFLTNPISLHHRTPARDRAATPYLGGALLHSGLPNPGLRRVLRQHAATWKRSSLPVWPHLFGEPEEIAAMSRTLEEVEGVAALEISIPLEADAALAQSLLQAARGELPLIACLPLQLARLDWLPTLASAGASAIHLDAPRGKIGFDPRPAGRTRFIAIGDGCPAGSLSLRSTGDCRWRGVYCGRWGGVVEGRSAGRGSGYHSLALISRPGLPCVCAAVADRTGRCGIPASTESAGSDPARAPSGWRS